MNTVMSLLKDQDGATAIEYGLIAALISIVCIAALSAVGKNLTNTFNTVASNLTQR
jgi:pilus assembly protein Flp/PilA